MPASTQSPPRIVSQSRRAGRPVPQRGAAPARGTGSRTASPRRGTIFHAPSFSIGLVLGAAIVLTTAYLPELLAPPPPPAKTGDTQSGTVQPAAQPLRFEFDSILRTTPAPAAVGPAGSGQPTAALPAGAVPGASFAATPGTATGTAPPLVGEMESASPGVLEAPGALPRVAESPALAPVPSTQQAARPDVASREPVAPRPPASAPATAPSTAAAPASYMLQAASFRSRDDADRLRAELLLLDLPANTGEVNVGNSVWYRVTVGPFADQQTADAAKERLRARNLTAIPSKR